MIPPGPNMQAPPAQQDAAAALAAVAASRARLLALALQAGQALEARVLGPAPGGMTRIAIAGQSLAISLPVPPPAGTVMQAQLRLDPAGGQPLLVLRNPGAAPPAAAQPPARVPPEAAPLPAPAPASAPRPLPAPAAAAPAAVRPPAGVVQGQVPTSLPSLGATASTSAPGLPAAVPTSVAAPAAASPPAPPVTTAPAVAAAPPGNAAPVAISVSPAFPQAQPAASGIVHPPAAPPAAPPTAAATAASSPSAPAATTPGPAPASISTAPAPTGNAAPANPTVPSPPPPATTPAAIASGQAAPPPPLSPTTGNAGRPPVLPLPVQPSVPPPAAGSPAGVAFGPSAQAAARQDSIAPLLQNLAALQSRMAPFPRPVAEAALRLLAGRLVLSGGTPAAAQLKQAVLGSGVPVIAPAPAAAAPTDLRTGLLQLRSALLGFLGAEIAPVAAVSRRPPPPTRDGQPRGHRAEPPTLAEGATPRDAGRTLLQQTDAALSRMRLLQLASLPQEAARVGAPPAAADWTLEVPMLLGSELAVAQLRIAADGRNPDGGRSRSWRLQFSVNFSILGEVGAQIGFSDGRTGVALWAEEPATAAALEAMLPELGAALTAKGLEVAGLRVSRHAPRQPLRPRAGQLLDGLR